MTHYALLRSLKNISFLFKLNMSQLKAHDSTQDLYRSQGKVKVTDLLSRLNEEKKIEKKRNLALGVAAVSAVTVFGIILTI